MRVTSSRTFTTLTMAVAAAFAVGGTVTSAAAVPLADDTGAVPTFQEFADSTYHDGQVFVVNGDEAMDSSGELRQMWEDELGGMRERIRAMRTGLVEQLKAEGVAQDFSFVIKQRGMFSYTGLTAAQVEQLKSDFGIYAVSTGRICLAALNSKNIGYVAKAIARVVKG